ncbi:MAG: NADH:ubiquinone reductase (Na(+)-transporting) subunit B [Planctomycetes bacterium]|nr:NADH:ubiquinone reductase (Na(+)-transporting) subunit B [Planctomycetota bacterium]
MIGMLRKLLDSQAKHFEEGGALHLFHPLYEAMDTLFYSPPHVTKGPSHVRDALDLKRMMGVVVAALVPCMLMAMYNTGYQANLAIEAGVTPEGWRAAVVSWLGVSFSAGNPLACFLHGAMYFLPVLVVTFAVGGTCEVVFALVRGHEVNEGFFVTGALFPLILPPTIPLWQVALGIGFAVILGKEIFGGTGMNIWNPALLARAFLFFAYAGQISGSQVWVAPAGYTAPTLLATAMEGGKTAIHEVAAAGTYSWWDAFLGLIPGSMGETSTLACLIGAAILIVTGIGSWRIMLSLTAGSLLTVLLFNALSGSVQNPFFDVPFWWHFVLGGWAFGAVFMATDPVSASQTETGRHIYGFLIGVLAILIRVANPAYPEGMMLAILLMNCFAALIDHYVVQANIRRRWVRNAAA